MDSFKKVGRAGLKFAYVLLGLALGYVLILPLTLSACKKTPVVARQESPPAPPAIRATQERSEEMIEISMQDSPWNTSKELLETSGLPHTDAYVLAVTRALIQDNAISEPAWEKDGKVPDGMRNARKLQAGTVLKTNTSRLNSVVAKVTMDKADTAAKADLQHSGTVNVSP